MILLKWIDIQLQPLVKKLPSYLKDDNDFLRKIDELNDKQTIPPNALLVTWDVKSLYTNIPHKERLEALEKTLQNEDVPRNKIETIIDFSKLVFNATILNSWSTLLTNVRYSNGDQDGTIVCEYLHGHIRKANVIYLSS